MTVGSLFTGIGGIDLAFNKVGFKTIWANDNNKYSCETYNANHDNKIIECDIKDLDINTLDDIDILCAGFPCQSFSLAGKRKGFQDERGNIFFEIIKIIKHKKPKVIFLENVKHLLRHSNGETFKVIKESLEKENYSVFYKILKACDYGLPTYRPRIYIVCFRNDLNITKFNFPKSIPLEMTMDDIFNGKCNKKIGYTLRVGGRSSGLYARRNWDSYLVDGEVIKITLKEAKKMMGFPDNFLFPVSETQALKQLGNGVAINVVEAIANNIKDTLDATG